ncbi:MAG: type II toxin-antitoxin system VapC family toxin [Acidobacteriota bacterium]
MNLVDSSAWLEYFADGPNAAAFAPVVQDGVRLVVPTIVLLEVRRRLLQQYQRERLIDEALASMRRGRVVPLDFPIAMQAAELGVRFKLPMADSIVLATARAWTAVVWTQDADFDGLDSVRYLPRQPR